MTQIVVPFRGTNGKRRLDAPDDVRGEIALAMLADVVTAAAATAPTVVATSHGAARELAAELGAQTADDPGGGQGAAVSAALEQVGEGPVLVVNADVPCVVPRDLRTLAGPADLGAIGYVEASDGTTNAISFPEASLFAPLYGAASAARFRDHAAAIGVTAIACAIPNLADDVDTLDDLERVRLRAGPRTQAALGRTLQP